MIQKKTTEQNSQNQATVNIVELGEVKEFAKIIPDFEKRLAVLPGITGFAQISGGYDLSPDEKLLYDLLYIKNQCFTLDVKISISTLKVMFSHDGAR